MSESASDAEVIRQFFNALTEEEKSFAGKMAADNLGLFLRAAINELDWYSYNLAREPEPSFDQVEQWYLMQLGMTRLIKLALEGRTSFDVPTVMFRRDRSISIPVLEIVAGLGMIEHGRRVAQMAMSGVGLVERTAPSEFLVTLPEVLPDEEYYERAVADHFEALASDEFRTLLSFPVATDTGGEIAELLTKLVCPFVEHFIGYDGDPALDTWLFGLASHLLKMKKGYDSFNYAVSFGGVPFQMYMLGLTFLVSLAIRHERFAEALVAKEPGVRLENVLTVSAEIVPFLDDMRAAMNFFGGIFDDFEEATAEQVRTIFKVLSVGRDNTGVLDRPGSALPLLIRTSENDCIRCQSAVLGNPMQFLLDSLRHHFPRDYDRNQRGRERSMQLAVRRVLDDAFPGLEYRDNVRIRLDGRTLTDVDVVVLEPATGAILLVQLKHQDIYGMDIHSRHARGARLKQQSERWLAALGEWIDRSGDREIASSLRLPRNFPTPAIYRVILARHFGHPVADLVRPADVAFANWDQFYNAILLARQGHEQPTLTDLVAILRAGERPGGLQQHDAGPRTEWIINKLKFTTRQEGGGRAVSG
jgi:hypothetical protein